MIATRHEIDLQDLSIVFAPESDKPNFCLRGELVRQPL
jgi:hypothetical protein